MTLTSKQRAYLKGLASTLSPVFHTRELIKIAVLKNCMDDPRQIAEALAERTHATVVHVIGKKIVLYKKDKDNPKILLPL